MGRPRVRTAVLGAETREALLAAFGTVWNAYRQLGLGSTDISFPSFARACRSETISPEHLIAIVALWEKRRREPVAA